MFEDIENTNEIGKNLKIIEFLKCELLNTVALLFETMIKGLKSSQELIIECLTNILLVTYVLGNRLGCDYALMDKKLEEKIKLSILEEHNLETWYGDLSSLNEHLNNHKK